VIPARNEAHRLPELLDSLQQLEYRDRDVLVVDDASSDGTLEVARSAGVGVVRVEELPGGWTGKCYACQVGAEQTSGTWLLFTDADTVHGSTSLTAALQAAEREEAQLLSVLARQRCCSLWERLLLPYAYALYFAGAWRINRPGRPAVANGQYMLIRRSAYEAISGHAAVRSAIIEDVALARCMAARGYRVVLARGETELTVRMYSSLRSIFEGFGKNAVRFIQVSPSTGVPTALSGLVFLAAATQIARPGPVRPRLALLVTGSACLIRWHRRFGGSAATAALFPISAITFQLIALGSIWQTYRSGGTHWKGRRY
jgi:chlorobactene glucosyltransferase